MAQPMTHVPTGEELKEIIQGPGDVEWRFVAKAWLGGFAGFAHPFCHHQIRDEKRLSRDYPGAPPGTLLSLEGSRQVAEARHQPHVRVHSSFIHAQRKGVVLTCLT